MVVSPTFADLYASGVYPDIGLKAAREARDKAKQLLAQGRDPTLAKKLRKAAQANSSGTTFQALADEFFQKKATEGKARKTLAKLQWLIGIALPSMGSRQINELSPREVLAVLRTVEVRGQHETARRLRAVLSEVSQGRAVRPEGEAQGGFRRRPILSARCFAPLMVIKVNLKPASPFSSSP
jgi:hypothetical protein